MPRPKAIRQRINYLRNKDIEKAPVARLENKFKYHISLKELFLSLMVPMNCFCSGTQVKTIKTEF